MAGGESFREKAPVVAGGRVTVASEEFTTIRAAVEDGDDWYVTGLVRDGERIAFVRNRWSDGWVLPGGSIESGETLEEAVVREIHEETGLDVTSVRPLACIERRFEPPTSTDAVTAHMAVFAAEADGERFDQDLGETPDEIEAASWFVDHPERIDGLSRDLLDRLEATARNQGEE